MLGNEQQFASILTMNSEPWQVYASPALIKTFTERENLDDEDIEELIWHLRRLIIDPLDVRAQEDEASQQHCLSTPSTLNSDQVLTVYYHINIDKRTVVVTSISKEDRKD